MNENSGSKADGVNTVKSWWASPDPAAGDGPEPIRKRGYHRALKQNKKWALYKKSLQDVINNVVADLYCPSHNAYILTGLSKWLPVYEGDPKIIPIVYGDPNKT
jgi:hypothetical protein